jgi:hypothetical protein
MLTTISPEEEGEIMLKGVEEVDSTTTISTHRTSTLNQTPSIKVILSLLRNLKVQGLNVKSMVSLAIKLLTATIEWTLHTKEDIHLQS